MAKPKNKLYLRPDFHADALSKSKALRYIDGIEHQIIPISHVSVFHMKGTEWELQYSGWECFRRKNELLDNWCHRSCGNAKKFISNYYAPEGTIPYFLIYESDLKKCNYSSRSRPESIIARIKRIFTKFFTL